MSNRDNFSPAVKKAVAMRAGWQCSFAACQQKTVGPSEETPGAFAIVGDAAHICAAAPGGRRFDETMSPEERSGIGNAIWLCPTHARLIDRDEATYTADMLRAMKAAREKACGEDMRAGAGVLPGAGLVAIGPDIVCAGEIAQVTAGSWVLHLNHFVTADRHALIGFIGGFATRAPEDRYVLSNELGDGRVLSEAPTLTMKAGVHVMTCPLGPSAQRIDAQKLGNSLALDPEANDLFLDGTSIALVSGVDYLPQKIQSLLSMQRGENLFGVTSGVRFFEYFEAFSGTLWLSQLLTLDVIRQAALPAADGIMNAQATPLQCVTRVRSVELLSESPENNRLPLRVDLEVQGVGRWQRDLSIYMPTREQMHERARLSQETRPATAGPGPNSSSSDQR
ncbi:hypothetical protein ASD46_23340 [Rhizobium sp. Root491]|uniref:HNH endonuclease n=1 Tax=Rhizobium sp. Root491 TaxID=1736548 RepID=UPI0007143DE1|nr:HNH endonuclease [Rhizobium sp. Root491]KQY50737.1 hypothetical protein ASD46_23340 [Rhizobium sp. Root491]